MKEEYVTHSQAKKLKKFGFDWDVNKIYNRPSTLAEWELLPWHPEYKNWNNEGRFYLSAPTLSLAQKWLREVKGIHIAVNPYCKENNSDTNICNAEDCFWSTELSNVPFGYWLNVSKGEFDTYEHALSAGIDAALELLTDKLNR